jgi:hypothetical protein
MQGLISQGFHLKCLLHSKFEESQHPTRGYYPVDGANINTRVAFINLSVSVQHIFIRIIEGELNVMEFTIQNQQFMSTLALFQPYLIPVLHEFWRVVRDQCFSGIAHPVLLLTEFSIQAFRFLFITVFPMH